MSSIGTGVSNFEYFYIICDLKLSIKTDNEIQMIRNAKLC